MRTIQKLPRRGRRDLKNRSFTAFVLPSLFKWAVITVFPVSIVLLRIPLILKTSSREARGQLVFLPK